MPKPMNNMKKTKPKQQQQQLNPKILSKPNNNIKPDKKTTTTTTTSGPTKKAVRIKGRLVTDLKSFLEEKKAEREGKFLEKSTPQN